MNVISMIANILAPAKDAATYATYRTQPGNSQGIDALGGSSETFFGKNKGKSTEAVLKKWTMICLAVLAVFAIVFFILQIDAIWS